MRFGNPNRAASAYPSQDSIKPMQTAPSSNAPARNNALLHAAIVIIIGVFATTLAQPQVLGRLPLQNLLKNELHVSKSLNASFFFLAGLPWYFKPFAGIFTDAFPILGTRRFHYIVFSAVMAVLGWISLVFVPHQYQLLLYLCIAINVFMVISSTVVGGYMVETAQATSGSGRLTAIRQFVQQTCSVIQGPTAGRLAALQIGITGYVCGGIMFLLVPATIFFLHEQRKKTTTEEVLRNAGIQLKNIGTAKTMWAAAGLMALFYVAPGFSTAIFDLQQDVLKMNTDQQGFLQLLGGVAGISAALIYGFFCKNFNLKSLLVFGLAIGTLANLGYLFYSSVGRAQMIEGFNGFGYTMAELVLMDLAVRSTPKGSEGLGFSLMMSVRNLALLGTDALGSMMMDKWHVQLNALVLSNAATTIITIPLVFLLPKVVLMKRDAEPVMDISEAVPERG